MSIPFLPRSIFTADPEYLSDYHCSICKNILHESVNDFSGHLFCQSCINEKLSSSAVCPVDGHSLTNDQLIETRHVRSFLSKQRVKCLYFQDGCYWEDTLGKLKSHLTICPKVDRQKPDLLSIKDDSEDRSEGRKRKSDTPDDLQSMSSEEVPNKRKVSFEIERNDKESKKSNFSNEQQNGSQNGLSAVPEKLIKSIEARITDLSTKIENKATSEAIFSKNILTRFDELSSKLEKIEKNQRNVELLLKKRQAEEDQVNEYSFFDSKFSSKALCLQNNIIWVKKEPTLRHEIFVFNKSVQGSLEASFMIKGKFNWLAFGLVDWKVFESKDFQFQPKEIEHGFNLVTSNGFTFQNGKKTSKIEHFKEMKEGQEIRLEYREDRKELIVTTDDSRGILEQVKKNADLFLCLLLTDLGEKIECLSIK